MFLGFRTFRLVLNRTSDKSHAPYLLVKVKVKVKLSRNKSRRLRREMEYGASILTFTFGTTREFVGRLSLKCDGTRAETRFRLPAKRTSPFKSAVAPVQSTTGSRGVRISSSNAGYNMFRCSVKSTGYTLHSPVSPSLPLPCITVCHHISTALYEFLLEVKWTLRLLNRSLQNFKRPYRESNPQPPVLWRSASTNFAARPTFIGRYSKCR